MTSTMIVRAILIQRPENERLNQRRVRLIIVHARVLDLIPGLALYSGQVHHGVGGLRRAYENPDWQDCRAYMKLNLKQDNTRSPGLQLNPVRFEFTDSTATTVSAAGRFNDWHPISQPAHPPGNGRWRVSCKLLLFCLFFTTACARGGPIVIGYTNCLAVSNYPQSLMDQIGQLKWYFAHASVGEYMMDGIAALHATNAGFYQLHGVSATNTPLAVTQVGVIYDFDRGNPGWWQKFDLFQSCVSNGWRYPLVNIAMNKLCFIDADAILDWCTD